MNLLLLGGCVKAETPKDALPVSRRHRRHLTEQQHLRSWDQNMLVIFMSFCVSSEVNVNSIWYILDSHKHFEYHQEVFEFVFFDMWTRRGSDKLRFITVVPPLVIPILKDYDAYIKNVIFNMFTLF